MTHVVRNIQKILPWLLLAPVLLPLVVAGGLMYPYLVLKTLSFYAVGLITLAALIVVISSGVPVYRDRLRAKRTWIPAALLALAYIASLFGIDFYRSFWSIYARGDGLLMLTLSVVSFYGILLIADNQFLPRLLRGVTAIGSAVALYGIGEWLFEGGRIGSLIGNAAFFAGYLGVTFFAALTVARLSNGWVKNASYIGASLMVIAIMLTATRGTILALALAAVVWLIVLASTRKGAVRARAGAVLLALVVLAGGFMAFRSSLATSPIQPIARIAQIGTNDPDVASRLFIWKNMVGEVAKSPFLGYGAEHIDYLFNRFYDPSVISEEWFDRSHNAFFDYAAQYGLGGFFLYVALIILFGWTAFSLAKKNIAYRPLMYAALVYGAQNFFVFDTVTTWWLVLALIAALLVTDSETSASPLVKPSYTYGGAIVGVLLVAVIIPASIMPLMANHDLFVAYRYQLLDVTKANAALTAGEKLDTYGALEYGYQVYDMYTGVQYQKLTGAARVAAYEKAVEILSANYKRFSYDARTALYYAHVLDLAPPERPSDPELEKQVLSRAVGLSPLRYQSWYILANLFIGPAKNFAEGSVQRAQLYSQAIQLLAKYTTLVPNLAEPHYVLAELYRATGDSQKSAAEAALGRGAYKPNAETARRAAGYYEGVEDWANAAYFLEQLLKFTPTDSAIKFDLAKVRFLQGDKAGSEEIVQDLRQSDPAILTTDQNFLTAITAYEAKK